VIPRKATLAHLPTPITHHPELDRLLGCEVWVKRDDMSAGVAAGNKIRKLEYLVQAALERGARCLVTCGGVQSNHARATAIVAREHGLSVELFLRTDDPSAEHALTGNLLLDRLVGAKVNFITQEGYADRDRLMAERSRELSERGQPAYVIPEGGSNGLGSLGYVDAMAEVRVQLDAGLAGGAPFDAVAHACGSGGTAAGVALGARLHGVAAQAHAFAVCHDSAYFDAIVARICEEARALVPGLPLDAAPIIHDAWKGPAYAVPSAAQVRFMIEVAQRTGLLFDPVYTGKALFGLAQLTPKPRRVLFIHTGGLPGLLADAAPFMPWL
jgi:D-cysteine desulfhydrase